MANGLARLGQAARKIFGGRKKVNLREVNTVAKSNENPTINSSRSVGYRPSHGTPGAFNPTVQTHSEITKGYRCGRNWIA